MQLRRAVLIWNAVARQFFPRDRPSAASLLEHPWCAAAAAEERRRWADTVRFGALLPAAACRCERATWVGRQGREGKALALTSLAKSYQVTPAVLESYLAHVSGVGRKGKQRGMGK